MFEKFGIRIHLKVNFLVTFTVKKKGMELSVLCSTALDICIVTVLKKNAFWNPKSLPLPKNMHLRWFSLTILS
jgi:hypothetical protein